MPLYLRIFGALLLEFLPIYAQKPPLVDFSFSEQAPSVVFGVVLILIVAYFVVEIWWALRK